MNKIAIKTLDELGDREPAYALVGDVDLCVVRYDDNVSVFYGRCLHRGALMADGHVDGENLICGVHYWDYRLDTGVSEYNNEEVLPKFTSWTRGRPGFGRRGRDRRLGAGPPAALPAGRVSRPLRRHAPRARGAPCGAHPGLCQGRAQQDRPPRSRRGHGRATPGSCRAGTTSSSSRRNFTACRTWMTRPLAPRW